MCFILCFAFHACAGLSFSPIALVPIFSVDRMQHAFNFPFQLTSLRTLLEFAPPAGKTVDTPDEALSGFIRLQIGGMYFAVIGCSILRL